MCIENGGMVKLKKQGAEKRAIWETHLDQNMQQQMKVVYGPGNASRKAGKSQIKTVQQTDNNCGCFASAMAIVKLLYDKSDDSTESIKDHAKSIEETAKKMGLSAFGELFSAASLESIIQQYASDKELGIDTKLIDFESTDEYKEKTKNLPDNSLVLFPFYAGISESLRPKITNNIVKKLSPDLKIKIISEVKGKDDLIKPEYMCNSHWGILNKESTFYRIYEGNQSAEEKYVDINRVVKSNLMLGNRIDFGIFLNAQDQKEKERYFKCIKDRKENHNKECHYTTRNEHGESEFDVWDHVKDDYSPDEFLDQVELRGKAIAVYINLKREEEE